MITQGIAQNDINGSAGFKIIDSKDENISQHYYKPFTELGWSGDSFNISASYYRWISYSVTDGLLNTKDIDINQTGAELSLYSGDIFILSGGYEYFAGDSSYSAHKFTGEFIVDFQTFEISIDSSLKNAEYEFNGTIKKSFLTAGGEISFDINEKFSWDLGYQHESTDYKTYGYTYTKNSIRAGIFTMPLKKFFFLTGVTGSEDSDRINSLAFDAGLSLKLFDHLKLSTGYMLTADFITSESVSTFGGGRRTSRKSSASTEISHTWNLSVSTYF